MNEKHSEKIVTDALQRLAAQWHIDPEYMMEKRNELRALLAEVGQSRFLQGLVTTIRDYQDNRCPPISVIRANVPDRQDTDKWWKPSPEEIRDRREHPEDYWGWADVMAIWRENEKRMLARQPFLSVSEARQVVREARIAHKPTKREETPF